MSAMSIALPAADVRDDGPLAHGSRGSARAAALEQLPLRLDHLCGLQASRRGTGWVTAHDGGSVRGQGRVAVRCERAARSGPVLGGTLVLDSDITPEHRLLECVRPSLSNLEHYSGRNVGAVMFQVRQQKSKGLAQAVFRKTTSARGKVSHLRLDPTTEVQGLRPGTGHSVQ